MRLQRFAMSLLPKRRAMVIMRVGKAAGDGSGYGGRAIFLPALFSQSSRVRINGERER